MTCEDCGATWRRSARFCGRCGAVLRATPRATEAPSRWVNLLPPRWLVAAVAACCLVVLGGVALVIGEPWETLQAAPSQDVEVPPSPEGAVPDDDDRPGVAWEPPTPTVLCQPAPCERWRVHLPSGTTVVDGDTAYHVGSTNWRTEATAIDVETGAVRWRDTMVVPDAVNGSRNDGPLPTLLTDRDDVIIVAIEGLLEARSRTDGEVAWAFQREGLLPFTVEAGSADTVLVLAGVRPVDPDHGPGWSSETILSIDALTGEPRWERHIATPLTYRPIPEGVILAITMPGEEAADGPTEETSTEPVGSTTDETIVALDPLTGEVLWRRSLPRHGFGASGSVLHLHQDTHAEFVDIRSGELLDLPFDIQDQFGVEMVGDLFAVRSHAGDHGSGHLSVGPLQHLAVFDRDEGVEHFTASAPGWVGTHALPDGGMVIASGEGDRLVLTALGNDGHVRWERELGVPTPNVWPLWPHVDDGVIAMIASAAPGIPDLAAHRFDASTGESLGSFHLDVDAGRTEFHDLELRWPVVVDHRSDGMRLHGPAGSLELTQHVQVLSVDPLVVRTPSGTLVGLDEERLLGAS